MHNIATCTIVIFLSWWSTKAVLGKSFTCSQPIHCKGLSVFVCSDRGRGAHCGLLGVVSGPLASQTQAAKCT